MSEKTIDTIVEGGKATSGPPLGPALGPMGVPAPQVIAKINEATKDFHGMKVPVKVIIDTVTKAFRVEVGSPNTAELIKKEAKVEKGSGTKDKVGNLPLAGAIKVGKMKKNTSLGKSLKEVVKEVLGTCVSMGISVEGKDAREVIKEIDAGKHDSLLAG